MTAPPTAWKVAVVEPDATPTSAGITSAVPGLAASVTDAPVFGAALEMVTVQVVPAAAARDVEAHCSEVMAGLATTFMLRI